MIFSARGEDRWSRSIFLTRASFCFTFEQRKKSSQAAQSGLSEPSVVWMRRRARLADFLAVYG
ncbi:MAG: hypothetical protein CFE26_02155 [Verrucomicrobiales bacterium VVV1]|nr:MAG: hypothetical protein CFE26_02155 [Verrucomicrobiales bacterium VVV1]